ncbi:hypothetical protein BDV93DRAFT_117423 [Ceratobasidium sp. AG-I]|nr:hypothetical protein BDV93DRAFT_117423 [Ceratobasidium sp. AG-I]
MLDGRSLEGSIISVTSWNEHEATHEAISVTSEVEHRTAPNSPKAPVVRDVVEETKRENAELRSTINAMRQAERERQRVWRVLNDRSNPQTTLSDTSSDTNDSLTPAPLSPFQQTLGGMVPMHDGRFMMDQYQPGFGYPRPGEPAIYQHGPMTPAIGGAMSASDVMSQLAQHGCQNITQSLDLYTCSTYPISSGGFGDIYRGKLKDGPLVAIKCMRVSFGSSDAGQKHLKVSGRHIWLQRD